MRRQLNKKWRWGVVAVVIFIISLVIYLKVSTLQSSPEEITICGGCQGQYGDLRIGMEANPGSGEYTLANGEKSEGRVARLWFSIRDKGEENKQMTVHMGEAVTIDKYQITVEYIHGGRGSVDLRIQEFKN